MKNLCRKTLLFAEGLKKVRKWLFNQEDCCIKLSQVEDDTPDWAKQKILNREEVYQFHVSQRVSNQIGQAISWIRSLEKTARSQSPHKLVLKAKKDLKKLSNMSIEQGFEKGKRWFELLRANQDKDSLSKRLFSKREVKLSSKHSWKRITSLAELHELGSVRYLDNCLKMDIDEGGGHHDPYFLSMESEYWGLYDEEEIPKGALQIERKGKIAREFKGKENSDPTEEMLEDFVELANEQLWLSRVIAF